MATRLVLLPYLQHWVPDVLTVRLFILPRGSPIDPLVTSSPSFASANFIFDVHFEPGLGTLPAPGGSPALVTIPSPTVTSALPLYKALEKQFDIDPSPPNPVLPSSSTKVHKHLPLSYQQTTGYAPGRTSLVFTDDTYSCAQRVPVPPPPLVSIPPQNPKIPWGKVIAYLTRNYVLAEAAGLIRTFDVHIKAPNTLKSGGFLYLTLNPSSDAADLLKIPDGLKIYATRIPALTAARDLFTPLLFPVVAQPPASDYSEIFSEIDDYDDGWAKAVHCAQPQQMHPLNETPDGSRPVTEVGVRIGWDDEQVTIWMNRQMDPMSFDSPLGVHGYRIDAKISGTPTWHSLVRATGPIGVPGLDLGKFDGELMVEIHPVQLEAKVQGTFWLPTYFAAWFGPSLASEEVIRLLLSGAGDLRNAGGVVGVPPKVQLTYGRSYDFRVRFMDHTGGGPAVTGNPAIPGPSPVGSIDFRRYIRPHEPEIVGGQPKIPDPPSLTFKRPLLAYPAVLCTGFYANVVELLINDMPAAAADRRDPGLPDPDVDRLQIVIEVNGLAQDPAATDGTFMPIVTTTRAFPTDPSQALAIDLTWIDVWDASTLATSYPNKGPLVLPTARDIRLRVSSLCREVPDYFGAPDVRLSRMAPQVSLRKESSDETKLFGLDLPSNRFNAFFFQPDPPVNPVVLTAQRLAGSQNIRPADMASRAAAAFGLLHDGFTMRSPSGRRVVFGCASAIRHVIGPDGASITFSSQADLALHWIVMIKLIINRDWSWDGLARDGVAVSRDGNIVGSFSPSRNVSQDAIVQPDRRQMDLIFFDAFEAKPAAGTFPTTLDPKYTVSVTFINTPKADPPLSLTMTLPVTTPPTQVPQIISAGIAMSPYVRTADYSSTGVREKILWIELGSPPANPQDRYFARVLRNAPDPLLTTFATTLSETTDPPLSIDPEPVRKIVQGEGDDRAGLSAMQLLIPSDSKLHWGLPLPAGMDANSLELFGFFTYELRVGHFDVWSTAQGRFGPPLRVAGVQHPPPPMICTVFRNKLGIRVSAPFAVPVLDGVPRQTIPPRSRIWVLLYAQAEQIDGKDKRNILLSRTQATFNRERDFGTSLPFGNAQFADSAVARALASLGFPPTAPLSVLAVELLPQDVLPADPLGRDLGGQRILRTSPLTPIPVIC